MKIAIWHNLPSGGAKRLLYYEVRELALRGHTIEVWCPPTADRAYLPIGEFAKEHVVPLRWSDQPNGLLARAAWPYQSVVRKLAAMDEHCRRCAEAIDQGGFDLLYAHGCMFFRVTAIGRYLRMPKVISLAMATGCQNRRRYRPASVPGPVCTKSCQSACGSCDSTLLSVLAIFISLRCRCAIPRTW